MIKAQFVGYTYSIQADCSVQTTFSLKSALGVVGPITTMKVAVPGPDGQLELRGILMGTPFGTPPAITIASQDLHRISMQN